MTDSKASFSGPKMTVLATVATNASVGLTIGAYSMSLLAIRDEFRSSLALAALGLSLAILTIGIFPPVIVRLHRRFSIRSTMIAGAAIAACAYSVLYFVHSIWVLLAIYALVIGPATVMFGQFASSVLMSNWYVEGRGRVLGIVGMPVLIMLVPLAAAPILANYGLRTLFLAIALAHIVLIPILFAIVDTPEQVGQHPRGDPSGEPAAAAGSAAVLGLAFFARRLDFWLLLLGVGLINGSGITKVSHLAAIATEQGRTLEQAALLLAVSGGSGIVGSFAFGWLVDRLGGAVTLVINATLQMATWSILLLHPQMPLLILDGIIMGSCGSGVYCLVAVVCSRLYGPANIGSSLAFVNAASTPFIFVMAPIAGVIHDYTGSYRPVIISLIFACAVSAVLFLSIVRRESAAERAGHKIS